MRKQTLLSILTFLLLVSLTSLLPGQRIRNPQSVGSDGPPRVTQGALMVLDPERGIGGICPLKHTEVAAEISGFLSRVNVTQVFVNPSTEKIEAVYTFPLPQNAAVDDMTLIVGGRTVHGRIKPREEARAIYQAAIARGHVAALLDQERPNIFTQSVGNIMPGEQVKIAISYVETLKYEDGIYEFVFPMVVGPRYIPGQPTGRSGGGWAPDTDRVPDASRITPPVALHPRTGEAVRAGHDISLSVAIDAGLPLAEVRSTLHEIEISRPDTRSALVRLRKRTEIPNRDFILRYKVAGKQVLDAFLTHRSERGGFFTLSLQPPERVTVEDVTPRELVFVLDTSGSMSGFPIEKAKETIRMALDGMHAGDSFNLITFAGDTSVLFPRPVPATTGNLRAAREFLASRRGSGGTEMMKAIRTALAPSGAEDAIRIVCFMTDGYVGNDMEIIAEVQRHSGARVFSFGIGNSVNRFLLDKMAEYGRGEVEYVTLSDDGSAAARRMHERIRNPILTDISIDWAGLPVADIYPRRIPDLFSAKPVTLNGRYLRAGSGVLRLSGKVAGAHYVREIPLYFPEREPRHDVVGSLWARSRIDELMGRDYAGMQRGTVDPAVREEITRLGMEFRLMTQFTSFVAVEEMTITDGGRPRRIEVPVEMPAGVDPAGIFGDKKEHDFAPMAMIAGKAGRAQNVVEPEVRMLREFAGAEGSRQSVMANIEVEPGYREEASRLHPAVGQIVERLRKGQPPAAGESAFVRDGKATIQVWLKDRSDATLKKMKELGFELVQESKTAVMVIGRIPIARLEALSKLDAVRYIAPL